MRTISENYLIATNGKIEIGSTSTAVLAANGNRKYALFINDSDEVIYLALGAAAELNKGIRLDQGERYEMKAGDGNVYQGAINAICTSGGKNLCYVEGE